MAQKSRNTLKGYFNTGDTPTEAQFADLIDSNPNLEDESISDGDVALNNTHRASNGQNHSDVVLNNTHRGSNGTDHANVDRYVKVEVSSEEILDINSNPKTLVAAPGAGKIVFPINLIIKYSYGATPYATNTALRINYDQGGTIWDFATLISESVDRVLFRGVHDSDNWRPENRVLLLREITGDPTAGDGTLTIHLWYKILTL